MCLGVPDISHCVRLHCDPSVIIRPKEKTQEEKREGEEKERERKE